MFYQTLEDIQKVYRDAGGYDMSYDEFEQLCRKAWEEEYTYLCIDKSKKGYQGRFSFCIESRNTYIDSTPETKFLGLTQIFVFKQKQS